MLKSKFRKAKGFTLVEIIVVIAIIGVLAAVIGVAVLGYMKDARDSRASTDARSISLVTQELIFSKYAGNNVKAALSGDSENYAFVYAGNGTSDAAVLEILEELGDPDYENGFVIFIDDANTFSPTLSVYVYIDNPEYATSCSKDVEPNGAFPESEMARFQ